MEPSSFQNEHLFLIDYSSFLQNNNNNNTSLAEQFGEKKSYTQMENSSSSLEMHHEFNHKKINASNGNRSLHSKECNRKRAKRDKKIGDKREKNNQQEEEIPKGYIHVRARRGQATDSHSLAERVRREKISARMKTLQGLVPGCDKVMGKASMLDEIINYVQSLQNQVEFLSMKLACMGPTCHGFGLNLYGLNRDQIHGSMFDNSSPSKSNVNPHSQEHESHVGEERQQQPLLLSQFLFNHIHSS